MNSTSPKLWSYVIGFVLSITLTLAAYFLVEQSATSGHVGLSKQFVIIVILVLALIQLAVQLVFFLHLGREPKPRWNLMVFGYVFLLVAIIVGGSLWIMYHLNYNMMQMSPTEVDHYMLDQ